MRLRLAACRPSSRVAICRIGGERNDRRLGNFSAEKVSERDLDVGQSLAAGWDTFGWVHFMSADTARPSRSCAPRGSSPPTPKWVTTWHRFTRSRRAATTRGSLDGAIVGTRWAL